MDGDDHDQSGQQTLDTGIAERSADARTNDGEDVLRAEIVDSETGVRQPVEIELGSESLERVIEVSMESRSLRWSGPIPPPSVFRELNEIIPDGADRAFSNWEKQTAHRIDMESTVIKHNVVKEYIGQFMAFGVVLAGLALAAYAMSEGYALGAVVLVFIAIGSVAGAFIVSRSADIKSARKSAEIEDRESSVAGDSED
jgi:uncharacterized membrane protein